MVTLLVIVLLGLAFGHFYLKTGHGQNMIKTTVNGAIPGRVDWEKIDISVLGGKAGIHGAVIADASENTIVDAGLVFLDVDIIELLRGNIDIVARFDQPRVMLAMDPNGELNILRALIAPSVPPEAPKDGETDGWQFPLQVILRSVIISEGFFGFQDYSSLSDGKPGEIAFSDINLDIANLNLSEISGRMVLRIGNSIIDTEGVYLSLSEFMFESVMEKGRIRPLTMDIQIQGETAAALNLSGELNLHDAFADGLLASPTDLDAIAYDLTLDAQNIDFDRLVWTEPYVSGIVRALVDIAGTGIFPKTIAAEIDATFSGKQITALSFLAPIDPEISVKGEFLDGKAFADPVEITIQDSRLRVTGEYDIFNHIIDAAVHLDTPDMAQFLEPLSVAVTSGRASLSGTIAGPVMQPEINADVDSKNLAYDNIRFGDVLLNASLDKSGRTFIDRLFADNRGSQVEINGHMDLFEGGFAGFRFDMPADLTAAFRQVEIPDFYPEINLAGKINGTLRLAEKITAPDAALSLEAFGLALDETHIGDLSAVMTLSHGTAAIDSLRLKNRQSAIHLTGTTDIFVPGSLSLLPFPKLDLVFQNSILFPGDFIDAGEGKITFEGHAKGDLNDLSAELSVDGTDLAAAGTDIGALKARVDFAEGRLTVSPLEITNQKSRLTITGGVDLFTPATLNMYDDPPLDINIAGDSVYLGDFVQSMSGRLSVSGEVNGSVGDPTGKIRIDGDLIDLGMQQIEHLRLISTFADQTMFIDTANITVAPGETIRASGHVSLNNRFFLEIDSDDIGIDRIGVLAGAGITGNVRIDASGEGSLDDPAVKGSISAFDLQLYDRSIDPLDIAFELKDRLATAQAVSSFMAQASYGIDTGDFNFTGNFDDTLLDPFLHAADLTLLSGSITGNITAAGNVSDLLQTNADVNIERLIILQQHQNNDTPPELVRVADLTARLENGAFSLPQNEIMLLETNPLLVSGTGRMDGAYEFMAEGTIPLAAAAAFMTELEDPEGEITFTGSISHSGGDTPGQPDFAAEIALHDLGLSIPVLMQKVSGVNGQIRITVRDITIEDIEGRVDSGRFTANGKMDMEDGFSPGQILLRITAHALPIRIPDTLEFTMNSEMTFSGTPDDSQLSGQVIFLDGLYYRDVEISLIGEVTRRRRKAAPTAEASDFGDIPYLKNLHLDIDTSFRKPLMVDNNLALMTLRPELRINNTLAQPRVSGRAEVGQGTVSYQNIEFEIAKGVIDFIDPYRIQPDIDIRAISNVRKWTILLEISGTPEDLEFTLSSNPAEEHADILSLLLFGQTTREMSEGTGTAGPTPQEMLVNLLADRLEEDVRAGTGLDIFEVEYTNGEGDAAESDPFLRVTVGKELSRRLIVTYGMERRSGETFHQQTAIYRLLEFLSMRAFQDTGGTYGGEMQFRLEFR